MSVVPVHHTLKLFLPAVGETPQGSEGAIPLPDIKETLKRKEEEERARVEEEKLKEKRRIKRSDKEAFTKVSAANQEGVPHVTASSITQHDALIAT